MPALTLHFSPDTCALVTLVALEEIRIPYDLRVVALGVGEQRSPEYLALNPKGKVPMLVVGDQALTENVAILTWLAGAFPNASLLPHIADELARATILGDLAYCASGLHPLVTRLRLPQLFCDLPDTKARVFEMATSAMRTSLGLVEKRLSEGTWWYGEKWSIVDAYLNWVWFRIIGAGFDERPFQNLARHHALLAQFPSVMRARAINDRIARELAQKGAAVNFDTLRSAAT